MIKVEEIKFTRHVDSIFVVKFNEDDNWSLLEEKINDKFKTIIQTNEAWSKQFLDAETGQLKAPLFQANDIFEDQTIYCIWDDSLDKFMNLKNKALSLLRHYK